MRKIEEFRAHHDLTGSATGAVAVAAEVPVRCPRCPGRAPGRGIGFPAAKLARARAAGSSAGMSPPVGSVAVCAATSSLLIRTPFARSRGRAGRDRRTLGIAVPEPAEGSVVPVPPGLGACGPCAGPRARSRTRNVLVRRLRSLGPRLAAGVPRGRPDEVRAPCRSLASAVPGEQVWTKDSSRPASDPQAGRSGAGKMVSHKGLRGPGVAPP